MKLNDCYSLLEIPESASMQDITSAFKRLAMKYHPDKNRDNIDWATKAMSILNIAYNTISNSRFDETKSSEIHHSYKSNRSRTYFTTTSRYQKNDTIITEDYEVLTKKFLIIKEKTNDALYKYFQYNLNDIIQRGKKINGSIFNKIINTLQKDYHDINKLINLTTDNELLEHFNIFCSLIFNFYKASECINIIDSYNDQIDVMAYRIFKKGDEALHSASKELFFDRHNRGFFRQSLTMPLILESKLHFNKVLSKFPNSTWSVETKIKLEYSQALRRYMNLFFTN